ncbi:MAG: GTP cyclohydrolase I FolE [Planctomycetes bacterium]|nr:GTP cyclohydrolase I FolE [Planctomycetota bacterium]
MKSTTTSSRAGSAKRVAKAASQRGAKSAGNPPTIAPYVRKILLDLGEDPDRDGLKRTPERFDRAMRYLTSGYGKTVAEVVGKGVFEQETDEMVIVKDIELYSLCEHHLVPFYGKAHVAYLPDRKIVGLSKVARLVDLFARRLQVQERLTSQIARALEEAVEPKGVAVVIEAAHLCMMMRGVEKQNSVTVTSCMLGRFRSDEKTRAEFLQLVYRGGSR